MYSTYLGGSVDGTGIYAIAVDSAGSAYVTGETQADDFPTKNPFQRYNKESRHGGDASGNAFVTKLNPEGDALVYSTYLGGSGATHDCGGIVCLAGDSGNGIAVDPYGEAYVAGGTASSDFPTKNAFQSSLHTSGGNAFVTKFAANGTALVFSTYLGGSGSKQNDTIAGDSASALALDSHGNAYLTGATASYDFPLKNAFQSSNPDVSDVATAFVAELYAATGALIYSSYLGGSLQDGGTGIAVDNDGNAYVAGSTSSTNFPTKDAFQPSLRGGTNAFVAKVSAQ